MQVPITLVYGPTPALVQQLQNGATGDIFSFYSAANSSVLMAFNTTVGYSGTMFDLNCRDTNGCGSTPYVFRDNIMVGFLQPTNNPANPQTPGLYYYSDSSDAVPFVWALRP